MKNKGVIHCDLKLENILFTDAKCRNIRLIDFGAGCESYESGFTYVQSRYYRAPETVLGIPYDHSIDMWSIGCILYEMAVGRVLFPGQDENEMLEYWVITIGSIPEHMLEQCSSDKFDLLFEKGEDDQAVEIKRCERTRLKGKLVPATQTVDELLRQKVKNIDPHLIDFITKCLIYNPADRMTAEEGLKHPFTQLV